MAAQHNPRPYRAPDLDRLHAVLAYDPDSGLLIWRDFKGRRHIRPGAIAGLILSSGYRAIRLDGVNYLAHHLAWLHFYGEWPPIGIDHIDGVRSNNAIVNLRLASQSLNMRNSKLRRDNSSGLKGVSFKAKNEKWCAQISVVGHVRHIGYFLTAEEAHSAYMEAAVASSGEFARAR